MRILVLMLLAALTACAQQVNYSASAEPAEAAGVRLTIEDCIAGQCDFVYVIENQSEACIAFQDLALPSRDYAYLDNLLSTGRRITAQPSERAQHTFVVLPPGGRITQGVSVRTISGLSELDGQDVTFRTFFGPCPGAEPIADRPHSFELITTIRFTRA